MKISIRTYASLMLLLCVIPSFGQAIKISSSGKVGINGEPNSGYNLYVNGSLKTTGSLHTNQLHINGHNLYGGSYLKISSSHIGLGTSYDASSTVKIAGESQYAIKVEGEAYITGGTWITSDGKLKKDIVSAKNDSLLERLLKLDPKSYTFKSREELLSLHEQGLVHFPIDTVVTVDRETRKEKKETRVGVPRYPTRKQYGLIAQELEQVFPEMVHTDSISNTQAINYEMLIPVMIQAIKEQEARIAALEKLVSKQ